MTPEHRRDVALIALAQGTEPSVGIATVFVRSGFKDGAGIVANPYHYLFVCLDLRLDLQARTLDAALAACPDLPEPLLGLAKELPADRFPSSESWSPGVHRTD